MTLNVLEEGFEAELGEVAQRLRICPECFWLFRELRLFKKTSNPNGDGSRPFREEPTGHREGGRRTLLLARPRDWTVLGSFLVRSLSCLSFS